MRCINNKHLKQAACLFSLLLSLHAGVCHAQKNSGNALADSIIRELPKLNEDTNKAATFNFLGKLYMSVNTEESIRYAKSGLALSQKLGWDNGMGTSYNILGICAVNSSGYSQALEYYHKAFDIFQRSGNKKGLMKVVGNVGNVYVLRGNYSQALKNHFIALRYAEELDDKRSIAINEGNIGSAYEYLHDYSKAFQYESKALKVYEGLHDSLSIADVLGNLGNLCTDQRKYTEALEFMRRALSIYNRAGNELGTGRMMYIIGRNYVCSGAIKAGVASYFQALQYADSYALKEVQSKVAHSLADVLIDLVKDTTNDQSQQDVLAWMQAEHGIATNKMSMLRASVQLLKKAVSIDMETSSLDELAGSYSSLADAQQLLGDYKDALLNHRQYTLYKDSVFSVESKLRITNLETQREIDLKDKQIEIDRLEVAKKRNERALFGAGFLLLLAVVGIVVRNIRLKSAKELSEKELQAFQARMNPHFIFNSLSSIQSLILNDEKEQSIDYLAEFSGLMRQVLDNSALSKVPLKTEIDMLRSYIELEHLRFDGFARNITIGAGLEESSLEVPGMIVQPFVENAILHGLISRGKGGRLDVTFERQDNHIICTVEDNGVGRVASAEINSRKRAKGRQSHGTAIATNRLALLNDKKRGLINTVTYIDKMEDGGVAAGTKVIIGLPIL